MLNHVGSWDIITLEELYKYKDNIKPMNTTWAVKLDDTGKDDIVWWCEGNATMGRAIRPCLRMEEYDIPVGTNVNWFGLTWHHIGNGILLCDYAVHYMSAQCNYKMIKDWVDKWYDSWVKR